MAYRFEKLSILVVEDTAPMRNLLVSALYKFGIGHIRTASDGEQAFQIFKKESPDIILTDWAMSNIDGIELTKLMRTHPESPNQMVPIILISGYSAWSRVEIARDAGVTEFLAKPFTANDIARRLIHVITKPRNFIETGSFFGPDRRRIKNSNFKGPFKRMKDKKATMQKELGLI